MTSDAKGNQYLWDAENRLIKIIYPSDYFGNFSQFDYDGSGKCARISEYTNFSVTSTKQLIWCGKLIREVRESNGAVIARYFSRGQTIGGSSYFYALDHMGSTLEMVDTSGSVQAQYNYDPDGQFTQLQGNLASDLLFAGYYFHSRSGLSVTLRRHYQAGFARWISRDPIGETGGINLYRYVLNNPISVTDPYGSDIGSPSGAFASSMSGGDGGAMPLSFGGGWLNPNNWWPFKRPPDPDPDKENEKKIIWDLEKCKRDIEDEYARCVQAAKDFNKKCPGVRKLLEELRKCKERRERDLRENEKWAGKTAEEIIEQLKKEEEERNSGGGS